MKKTQSQGDRLKLSIIIRHQAPVVQTMDSAIITMIIITLKVVLRCAQAKENLL